jgi:hypothetical protein
VYKFNAQFPADVALLDAIKALNVENSGVRVAAATAEFFAQLAINGSPSMYRANYAAISAAIMAALHDVPVI